MLTLDKVGRANRRMGTLQFVLFALSNFHIMPEDRSDLAYGAREPGTLQRSPHAYARKGNAFTCEEEHGKPDSQTAWN